MEAVRTADEIRDVNTRYHDVAADTYDTKWGIDFGEIGQGQVLGKLRKLLGPELDDGYDRSLEIGAGTGYFSLNLLQAGVVSHATCTDISPGMVVDPERQRRATRARRQGRPRRRRVTAVRRPELRPAARARGPAPPAQPATRVRRVSPRAAARRPDRVRRRAVPARRPDRLGPQARGGPGRPGLAPRCWAPRRRHRRPRPGSDDEVEHDLERFVDIHAFAPADLTRHARRAGFTEVQVRGEELAANWFGWFNRSLEASADPDDVPMLWRQYAFHGYLLLQRLDTQLLEPRLPASLFYNLLLTARR